MNLESKITQRLDLEFSPTWLEVQNESYMHNVPKGAETHFKVIIVSEHFSNQSLVKRHRAIYKALADLTDRLHALSLNCYTIFEWDRHGRVAPASPECQGAKRTT